jgi:hypothetical protein
MANQTISEALKNLFIELGGDPTKLTDNQKVSDYIDDLATVLGGPETFEITLGMEDSEYTIDKTKAEIEAALASGAKIVLKLDFVNFTGSIEMASKESDGIGFVGALYGASDDFQFIVVHLYLGGDSVTATVGYQTITSIGQ